MNYDIQEYRGIPIRLIKRNYAGCSAKRYTINETNQNVWIPNRHLEEDGTIRSGENIDYVFRSHCHQLYLAGITQAIIGIKSVDDNSYLNNTLMEKGFRITEGRMTNDCKYYS